MTRSLVAWAMAVCLVPASATRADEPGVVRIGDLGESTIVRAQSPGEVYEGEIVHEGEMIHGAMVGHHHGYSGCGGCSDCGCSDCPRVTGNPILDAPFCLFKGWCKRPGCRKVTYPVDPSYFDRRDGQVYSAYGYGAPMAVPLAPTVHNAYNFGWGIPSSRITPVSRPRVPVVYGN